MMSTPRKLALIALLLLSLSGCASATGDFGLLYTGVSVPGPVTDNEVGLKTGKSCVTHILFIPLSRSDKPPMATAAEDGEIVHIGTVNHSTMNVLGLFRRSCTVVTGE
ncbi:TRL domain-containing protein [Lujinxingia sediminis]|nr:TRL domain-containing protein [Lujinxingia sediminis]